MSMRVLARGKSMFALRRRVNERFYNWRLRNRIQIYNITICARHAF